MERLVYHQGVIIDSTAPVIILNSPGNNSVIIAGTTIDIGVLDANNLTVNCSINGGINQTLNSPYDIDTIGWTDGLYTIEVRAIDDAGNTAVETYEFTIDSTMPIISLNSPGNNSVIQVGTILDFNVSDLHLDIVNYSVNGGLIQTLTPSYDIDTTGWSDGLYSIEVHAIDDAGNTAVEIYEFMIDTTSPAITLNSPANNSVIPAGTMLDFDVSDPNLNIVNYSINGGANTSFSVFYSIDTAGWIDGLYVIEVHANDILDNNISRSFNFIIDSTDPVIILNSPANDTIILPGTVIDIDIVDDNIDTVNYSANGGAIQTLISPLYDIDTTGWVDGTYTIEINAIDDAGNTAVDIYEFMIDTTPPVINAGSNITTNIEFTQNATATDTTSGIATYNWTKLSGPGTITFGTPNTEDTNIVADIDGTYIIRLTIIDNAGNPAFDEFELVWDTTNPPVDAGPNITTNTQFLQNATASDATSGIADYQWTQESGPGTITFGTPDAEDTTIQANIDGTYIIRLNVTDNAGNWAVDNFTLTWDTETPITTLSIGNPSFVNITNQTWFNRSTSFNLTANDPSGIGDIWYRTWNSTWTDWIKYDGNFTIPVDPWYEHVVDPLKGLHYIEYYSNDTLGNSENVNNVSLYLDVEPPMTVLYPLNGYYFSSLYEFSFASGDYSFSSGFGCGVNSTWYRIWANGLWSDWTQYSSEFYLNGEDGLRYIEYYSVDNLTQNQPVQNKSFMLDNTPPTVVSTTPSNQATGVDVNGNLTIVFSEPIETTSVPGLFVTFNPAINWTLWDYTWLENGTVLVITYGTELAKNTTYDITIDTYVSDRSHNALTPYSFSFTTWLDIDDDGIPDSEDTDNDNDGVPDSDDDFPYNPEENIDTDGDGIGDNADPDDDNDGVPDDIDSEPSNPDVGEVIDEPETPGNDGNYLWIILILIIAAILGAAFMLARKKPQPVIEEEAIMETELCPKCGFEIEKGSACPFCVEEEPQKPEPEPPKPKSKFTNEEMLEKIEKSYSEGKLTEEQYLKNKQKFS